MAKKGGESKVKKRREEHSQEQTVTSIADLFGTAAADPALSALFSPSVSALYPFAE
jgi:hypothetical protein